MNSVLTEGLTTLIHILKNAFQYLKKMESSVSGHQIGLSIYKVTLITHNRWLTSHHCVSGDVLKLTTMEGLE